MASVFSPHSVERWETFLPFLRSENRGLGRRPVCLESSEWGPVSGEQPWIFPLPVSTFPTQTLLDLFLKHALGFLDLFHAALPTSLISVGAQACLSTCSFCFHLETRDGWKAASAAELEVSFLIPSWPPPTPARAYWRWVRGGTGALWVRVEPSSPGWVL